MTAEPSNEAHHTPSDEWSLSVWTLKALVRLAVVLVVGEVVAALVPWTGLGRLGNAWRVLAPTLLLPGILSALITPSRHKTALLGALILGVTLGATLMGPMVRTAQDRGVSRDIPALEAAWAHYQAGTLGGDDRAELLWYFAHDRDPLFAVTWWRGRLPWDGREYGSLYVPHGSRGLCERLPPKRCHTREIEPGFYYYEMDI